MSSPERATLRGTPVVDAPGKVFLVGEYAVLHGGAAVLAAVDRRAVAQFVPAMEPPSEVVAQAVRVAREGIGDRAAALPDGSVLVDSSDFQADGKKLGIGSSSAVAAAAVGAVMELAGLSVAAHRDLCFTLADGAHRAAQGGVGSGADVAAAVHGGIIQFTRAPGGFPVVQRMRLPSGVQSVIFAEGTPAATPDLIRAVAAFAEKDRGAHDACIDALRRQAEAFIAALGTGDAAALLAAVEAHRAAMADLGQRADVPIVTSRFELAAELALNLGGAAKPSGAGGGDVGVAFFVDTAGATGFAQRADALGLKILNVGFDTGGVSRRQPARTERESEESGKRNVGTI